MTPSRRVDDGEDNGRSCTPDIGERIVGTGHNTVHYIAEQPHKRLRLQARDVTAPDDAEDADKEEAAVRIYSSCCISGNAIITTERVLAFKLNAMFLVLFN
jgi:hypothetical protein